MPDDFSTAPLKDLCSRPLDEMTEAELRDYLVWLQESRQSPHTFRARVEAKTSTPTKKTAEPKTSKALDSLEELF